MASRSPQTHAKRARELAVKERRERKRLKKAEVAAARAAGHDTLTSGDVSADLVPAEDHHATAAP
jgi:hypothetical protein